MTRRGRIPAATPCFPTACTNSPPISSTPPPSVPCFLRLSPDRMRRGNGSRGGDGRWSFAPGGSVSRRGRDEEKDIPAFHAFKRSKPAPETRREPHPASGGPGDEKGLRTRTGFGKGGFGGGRRTGQTARCACHDPFPGEAGRPEGVGSGPGGARATRQSQPQSIPARARVRVRAPHSGRCRNPDCPHAAGNLGCARVIRHAPRLVTGLCAALPQGL